MCHQRRCDSQYYSQMEASTNSISLTSELMSPMCALCVHGVPFVAYRMSAVISLKIGAHLKIMALNS